MLEVHEAEVSFFFGGTESESLNEFQDVGQLLEGEPLEREDLVVREHSFRRTVLEFVSRQVASAVDDVDDADDDRRHGVDLTEDLLDHSSELSVDAELLDDGGADAVDPLSGCAHVGEDGIVADGLVLGHDELLRLDEEPHKLSLPLIELSGAVVDVAANAKRNV